MQELRASLRYEFLMTIQQEIPVQERRSHLRSEFVSVRLSPDEALRLRALSKRTDVPLSRIIRELVKPLLAETMPTPAHLDFINGVIRLDRVPVITAGSESQIRDADDDDV